MKDLRVGLLVVLVGFLVMISVTGCIQESPTTEEKIKHSESAELFFKTVDMSINGTPLLNQSVELTVVAESPSSDVPNATLKILLPEGFKLVGGDLKWQGDLQENKRITLNAVVKPIKKGDWAIQFLATANPPRGFIALETEFLYVSVSETSAEVNNEPSSGIEYKFPQQEKSRKTPTEEMKLNES